MDMARENGRQGRDTRRAGMTIVELMVALVLFAVVAGVVFGFLTESRRSYNSTRQKAQYQQGLRAVMSLVTRELRSAGCDPTSAGFERFAVADDNTFRCRMDLNGDADVTDTNPDEDVTYTFNAGTGELSRTVGGVATVIMRDLSDVTFNYYDDLGNLMAGVPLNSTQRADIHSVDFVMTGQTAKHEPVSYTTRIAVRNG